MSTAAIAHVEYVAAVSNFEAVANPDRVRSGECSDEEFDAANYRLTVARNRLHDLVTRGGAS